MISASLRRAPWLVSICLAACTCPTADPRPSVDIESRTNVTGTINGSAIEGTVTARLNTGRGGASTCRFTKLPPKFTPGTIGTHA